MNRPSSFGTGGASPTSVLRPPSWKQTNAIGFASVTKKESFKAKDKSRKYSAPEQ